MHPTTSLAATALLVLSILPGADACMIAWAYWPESSKIYPWNKGMLDGGLSEARARERPGFNLASVYQRLFFFGEEN